MMPLGRLCPSARAWGGSRDLHLWGRELALKRQRKLLELLVAQDGLAVARDINIGASGWSVAWIMKYMIFPPFARS